MALTLPFPNSPLNGDPGNPVPVNQNFTAIAQAIQSFDASQIAAGTVTSAAFATSINPITRTLETVANFVYTGVIWTSVSGLNGTCTGGTLYVNGNRIVFPGVVSHTFTASQDTYIDIDYLGNVYYSGVSNGSVSSALTANSVRVAIVITGGSTISSVNQGSTAATAPTVASNILTVSDSIGNLIYPLLNQKLLGYRSIASSFTTTTTSSDVTVTGLDVCAINLPTVANVKISWRGRGFLKSGTAGDVLLIKLFDTSTQLQEFVINIPGSNYEVVPAIDVTTTATSGLHTYKLTVQQTTAGTISVDSGGTGKLSSIKAELD